MAGHAYPSVRAQLVANVARPATAWLRSRRCWPWKGRDPKPRLYVEGRYFIAARVAWQLRFGAIPDGLRVVHGCGNRQCMNPTHLLLANWAGWQRVRCALRRRAKR